MLSGRDTILGALSANRSRLRNFSVRRLGLFGSYARGDQKKSSDVDLLVEFSPGGKTVDNYMGLADYLETTLGEKVDLLTPESLSPTMREHVEREVLYFAV